MILSSVKIQIKVIYYVLLSKFLHSNIIFKSFADVLFEKIRSILQDLMVGSYAYLYFKSRAIIILMKSTDVGNDIVNTKIELRILFKTWIV